MTRQQLVSSLGVAIGVAGIGFVVLKVVADWDEFSTAVSDAQPGWLVVALVFGIAAIAGIGVNWSGIIGASGMRWFFVGQLGKYVPGGIWPVVGQAELARRGGVPRRSAYTGTAVSMLATLLGAVAVGAVSGLASPNDRLGYGLALLAGLVVAVPGAGLVQRMITRDLELPGPRALGVLTLRHVPVWLCFSAVNVCTVISLGGPHDAGAIVDIAFVTCLSWMAGFVIVGLPGGLGVREAVFVSLMTVPLGAGLAVSVAVVGRIVSIAADLAAAGASVATIKTPWSGPSN